MASYYPKSSFADLLTDAESRKELGKALKISVAAGEKTTRTITSIISWIQTNQTQFSSISQSFWAGKFGAVNSCSKWWARRRVRRISQSPFLRSNLVPFVSTVTIERCFKKRPSRKLSENGVPRKHKLPGLIVKATFSYWEGRLVANQFYAFPL